MKALLFALLLLIAFSSIVSGILLVVDPQGGILKLPVGLLKDTWFTNYLIPGIVLAAVVGGAHLLAVVYNLQKNGRRYNWAMAAGTLLVGWITVQVILIGLVHMLQPVLMGTGLLIVLIAYQLKGKWAV